MTSATIAPLTREQDPQQAADPAERTRRALALVAAALPGLSGEKFVPEDVTPPLFSAASTYAADYRGTFSFMVEMRQAALGRRGLSLGQAKGVLNCMRAELARAQRQAQPPAPVEALGPVAIEPGLYIVTLATGERVNVRVKALAAPQAERYGAAFKFGVFGFGDTDSSAIWLGTLKENRIVRRWPIRSDEIPASYLAGVRTAAGRIEAALQVLAGRATAQEVAGRAFAETAGACFRCGKALTDDLSRARGIGPDCYSRERGARAA
jgi:hypothetical protein